MLKKVRTLSSYCFTFLFLTLFLLGSPPSLADPENKKIKGYIDGIASTYVFTVEGRVIRATSETVYKDGSLADIQPGHYAEIKGERLTDGSTEASEIKFKPIRNVELDDIDVSGGGVKGPLAFALVTSYEFDGSLDRSTGFEGTITGTGSTDDASRIRQIRFPRNPAPMYILETSADGDTIDLTTGQYPVITSLRTIVTADDLLGINRNEPKREYYATLLTTLATDIAVANATDSNVNGVIDPSEFLSALAAAESLVVSTVGFGMDENIDIFNTPPLVNSSTETAEDQEAATQYRAAIEALTAIVYQIQEFTGDTGVSTDEVLTSLASDLSDGLIDGQVNGELVGTYDQNALDVFETDPLSLPIPNTTSTVADVPDLLVEETADTRQTAPNPTPEPVVISPVETNPDIDGDGVPNAQDAFPEDPNLFTFDDADGDGWPVGQDPDDNDPEVPVEIFIDTDGDGFANEGGLNPDSDDDGDGVSDVNELIGAITDPLVQDTDGDGALDGADLFPLDPTVAFDSDNDGVPNSVTAGQIVLTTANGVGADAYVDNDPVARDTNFGSSDVIQIRNDGDNTDGFHRHGYVKFDINGISSNFAAASFSVSLVEGFLSLDPELADEQDLPGFWDIEIYGLNDDIDADQWSEAGINWNNAPGGNGSQNTFNPDFTLLGVVSALGKGAGDTLSLTGLALHDFIKADTDGYITLGLRRANTTATETSGVLASKEYADLPAPALTLDIGTLSDNCTLLANPDQSDIDNDGFGDICDSDVDGDGAANDTDLDDDNDGVPDDEDAFPLDASESVDTDADGIGNNADTDDDGDGFADADDAFPLDDAEWLDTDGDGTGNNADTDDDNDGYADTDDAFPLDANEWLDTDGDGIGNNADTDDDGDGYADTDDAFPLDGAEWLDTDNDGIGNSADTDDDGDG